MTTETKKTTTKPKKKSIYSRKLKDITGDGKRNFADTYLGDLIGLDGKIGIGKGRPGLKASLKGARREDPEGKKPVTKKTTKKTIPKVRPKARPKPKPKNPYTKPDRNGIDKAPKGHGFEISPRNPNAKPSKPDAKNRAQVLRNMKKITLKQWTAMNRTQRKNVGLPTSNLQMRLYGASNFKR